MSVLKSIYLSRNLFISIGVIISFYIVGSFLPLFIRMAEIGLLITFIALISEVWVVFRINKGVEGERIVKDRLSSGDQNPIYIHLQNAYAIRINLVVIDELPVQFQIRDKEFACVLQPNQSKTIKYDIRPTERGVYTFGNINVFVSTVLGLIKKRIIIAAEKEIAVYPSYMQVKKYAFLAISDKLDQAGIKSIRKLGHNYEFDQIKEFVTGDDYRAINWNATARKNSLMVNQYQDEKSQNVIAVINKGRVMKMPFEEMTLLDHSINSALVLLNNAHLRDDYPGLITFNKSLETVLKPGSDRRQMNFILESLYKQSTDFSEANYEKLYTQIRHSVKRRSLVFLYTNFESMLSLKRELPYLLSIAKFHRLIVVFFKNTELGQITKSSTKSVEDIYVKTIAFKFAYEKQLIVKELQKHGIDSILTSPKNLTIQTINKYMEIKNRFLV